MPVSAWAGGPGGEAPLGQVKATLFGAQASDWLPTPGWGSDRERLTLGSGCPTPPTPPLTLADALVSQELPALPDLCRREEDGPPPGT